MRRLWYRLFPALMVALLIGVFIWVWLHTHPVGKFDKTAGYTSERIHCTTSRYHFEYVSSTILAVDRNLSFLRADQLERFADLVAHAMGTTRIPTVVWWVGQNERIDTLVREGLDSSDPATGMTILPGYHWDGCTINHLVGMSVAVSILFEAQEEYRDLENVLHELSHTLGSIHGAETIGGVVPDDLTVHGPQDAYWWSNLGINASLGRCGWYQSGSLENDLCNQIIQIFDT